MVAYSDMVVWKLFADLLIKTSKTVDISFGFIKTTRVRIKVSWFFFILSGDHDLVHY